MKDLEHTTEEDFDRAYRLNVKGPYFLVQVRSLHHHIKNRLLTLPTRKLHRT